MYGCIELMDKNENIRGAREGVSDRTQMKHTG